MFVKIVSLSNWNPINLLEEIRDQSSSLYVSHSVNPPEEPILEDITDSFDSMTTSNPNGTDATNENSPGSYFDAEEKNKATNNSFFYPLMNILEIRMFRYFLSYPYIILNQVDWRLYSKEKNSKMW